jgi:glucokinase
MMSNKVNQLSSASEIAEDKLCYIGLDLGGTSIKYALVNKAGLLMSTGLLPTFAEKGAKAVIQQLQKSVEILKNYAEKNNKTIQGIGIGTPGIVDVTGRIVIGGSDNITGWENLFLSDSLEEKFGWETRLINDANAMAMGECVYGAAQGCSDIIFLTIGTGIGGAIVIDGKLCNGYNSRGGELGHIPVEAKGKPCSCGSVGCLEAYASTSSLISNFIEKTNYKREKYPIEKIDGKFIVQSYLSGDPIAIICLNEQIYYLGRGIAAYINILSPERIVLGGGLSEAGEFYLNAVRHIVHQYAMPDCNMHTQIIAANLGNNAGCLGAASLFK